MCHTLSFLEQLAALQFVPRRVPSSLSKLDAALAVRGYGAEVRREIRDYVVQHGTVVGCERVELEDFVAIERLVLGGGAANVEAPDWVESHECFPGCSIHDDADTFRSRLLNPPGRVGVVDDGDLSCAEAF